MEQFDDILRTFINEMNKFESRFGAIRDEEKMLAVKKLMPESLLNYRFRGTTMSYSGIIIALENTIVDKVSTVPSSKNRRNDTSAPMEIGMAAREDGEGASQEEIGESWSLCCTPSTKEQVKENGDSGKVKIGARKAAKVGRMEERIRGRRAAARKEDPGKIMVAKENPEHVGRAVRQDTLQLGVGKEETKIDTLLMKMTVSDQQAEQEKGEEGQSSVTVEHGEQSQFKSEEDCGGERQVGEGQSHHGFWSRGSCDA